MREDWLERLVLRFFEQRIFRPMRLDRLAKQLRAHDRDERRNGKLAGTRMRQQIAELDRKIKAQVQAPEKGIDPSWSRTHRELRGEKEALEEVLAGIGADPQEAEDEELTAQLARLPDLGEALREAPPAIKRQVFASFDLQIVLRQGRAPCRTLGDGVRGRRRRWFRTAELEHARGARHAEAEHGDGARLGVAQWFEVDPAEGRGRKADPVAQEHR